MAIYQGARRAPLELPRRRPAARPRRAAIPAQRQQELTADRAASPTARRGGVATTRRRPSPTVRAHRRTSPVSIALSLIVVAFVLGLVYLTQSIRVAATSFEIDRLLGEQQRLEQQLQTVEGSIGAWAAGPAVVERAGQLGLDRLGGTLRLPPP